MERKVAVLATFLVFRLEYDLVPVQALKAAHQCYPEQFICKRESVRQ